MNYIGSKKKLSDFILSEVTGFISGELSQKTFCDLFAGTGTVGALFKDKTKKVISNDLEYYSYLLNRHYIGNTKITVRMRELLDILNRLPADKEGIIFTNYSRGGSDRNYFKEENAKKIDTIRQKIEEWDNERKINEDEKFFLLAMLLEAADKVANTASVYGAYLKHIKKSAQKDLVLQVTDFIETDQRNEVFNANSNDLIKVIKGDILYLDPPYNQRQYGANYHLLNTIAKYDDFTPQGKTGLREDYQKSLYCRKNSVLRSFEELIAYADFKYIFLSYNNEGLMSESEIREIMSKRGKYSLATKAYQRFKADKDGARNHTADSTVEYLHILKKP